MTNACKFTSKGWIELNWGEPGNKDSEGFFISVADTGKGITDKDKVRIFERFYKDRESEGTGLGLAIVSELVEVMGGKIEIAGSKEQGTRFTIKF